MANFGAAPGAPSGGFRPGVRCLPMRLRALRGAAAGLVALALVTATLGLTLTGAQTALAGTRSLLGSALVLPKSHARLGAHRSPALSGVSLTASLHLPPYADRSWWSAAVTTRHFPSRSSYDLAAATSRGPAVLVFVFHQVCPSDWPLRNGPDYITPGRLASDFAFLREHHIATLTPAELLGYLDGRQHVRAGSVFLAFDNGLEGVYRYAFPLARKDGIHFSVFLIGHRTYPVWKAGDKYLAWNQVRAMDQTGLVGIESETYDLHGKETIARHVFGPDIDRRWETYPDGHLESFPRYARRLRYAFVEQRQTFVQHLGTAPTLLVWPFSTYNRLAELDARAAGYKAAFAVYPGVVARGDIVDRFALPRNPATFMWDSMPEEYDALMDGVRLPWPPNNPAALEAGLERLRASHAAGEVATTAAADDSEGGVAARA